MPFRLIMSDIDGTFLNSQKQIPSETIKICRRLYQEKKTRFALASGRGIAGIRPVADAFGLPVFILPCNGAETYDETGRLICQKTLLFQDVPAIKKTVKEINPQIETIVYAGQDWIADEFTDIVKGECYVMPTKPVIGSFETVVSPAAPVLQSYLRRHAGEHGRTGGTPEAGFAAIRFIQISKLYSGNRCQRRQQSRRTGLFMPALRHRYGADNRFRRRV